MKIKNNSFFRNFIYLFSSNILTLLLGVLTSIIVARFLAPEGLGLKTLLVNFPTLFVSIFEMGTRQSTIYLVGNHKYNERELIGNVLLLWLIASVLGIIVYAIVCYFQFSTVQLSLLVISASYIPIKIGHSFLSGFLLGKELIKKLAKFNILNAVLTPVVTLLFLIIFDWGVLGVILASQIVALYTLLIRVFLLRKELNLILKFDFNFTIVKDLVSYGFFYAVALFLMTNFSLIPIFLMNNRVSNFEIGVYSAAMSIAMMLKQVISSTFPILFAKGANSNNPKEYSGNVHKLLRVMSPFLLLSAIILYFAIIFIVPLMYGNKYIESIRITQILLFGVFAYLLQYILIMDMAGKGRPVVTIKAILPAFIICIILNYFFIDKYASIGAAYATSISMVLCSISYFFVYSKETGFSISEIIKPRISDWIYLKTIIKRR